MRGINKRRIIMRENVNDIRMRKRGEGNHLFNEDGMRFPTMAADNSDNLNFGFTIKKINKTSIRGMISPVRV